jgi:type VI secretion system secreted protein VgrG
MDEFSSYWIRVSQAWTGDGWGAMFIPRIGQEVIVDFIDGNPDLPIITGRVYNAESMPPYELPAGQTKSTIKSNSSIGGGNSNEIRFEDKLGEEEVFISGAKDMNIQTANQMELTGESIELRSGDNYIIIGPEGIVIYETPSP